jgi:hypothetical protein
VISSPPWAVKMGGKGYAKSLLRVGKIQKLYKKWSKNTVLAGTVLENLCPTGAML